MTGRREHVSLLTLALERSVHVDAYPMGAHSRFTAFVVVCRLVDNTDALIKLQRTNPCSCRLNVTQALLAVRAQVES